MSETSEVSLKGTVRVCRNVLIVAACLTSAMIYISLCTHFSWAMKVFLILTVAAVNGFVLVSYLMHLLSEKKMVFTVLFFTACFFASLVGLTLWAMHDFPVGTTN